jgi:hypothetical protein
VRSFDTKPLLISKFAEKKSDARTIKTGQLVGVFATWHFPCLDNICFGISRY